MEKRRDKNLKNTERIKLLSDGGTWWWSGFKKRFLFLASVGKYLSFDRILDDNLKHWDINFGKFLLKAKSRHFHFTFYSSFLNFISFSFEIELTQPIQLFWYFLSISMMMRIFFKTTYTRWEKPSKSKLLSLKHRNYVNLILSEIHIIF